MFKPFNMRAIDYEVEHHIYLAQLQIFDTGEEVPVLRKVTVAGVQGFRPSDKMAPILAVTVMWLPKYSRLPLDDDTDGPYQVFTEYRHVVGMAHNKRDITKLIRKAQKICQDYADPVEFTRKELQK